MTSEVISAETTVAAPPAAVFAVLSDPVAHPSIDGTGWVAEALDREPLDHVGQVFRMAMFHTNHPDGAYEMANLVTVLDPDRVIGWQPGQADESGVIGYGGWIWRYDLTPVDGGTRVELTYDWSQAPAEMRAFISFPPFGPDHLENSLQHLAALAIQRAEP